MQTFLPYADFERTAQCLDYRRLGKQRVETKQILQTLEKKKLNNNKIAWANHPAVLMWEGYELSLAYYGLSICKEWIHRGYKDTLLLFFDNYIEMCNPFNLIDNIKNPVWLGNPQFHLSHQSNLLRKNSEYYSKYFNVPDSLPYFWPKSKGE